MKQIYSHAEKNFRAFLLVCFLCISFLINAQVPTTVTAGVCSAVVANFNTNDQGYNSPSIYGGTFDSSFYYNASRGYWTEYFPPYRTAAPTPGSRTITIISPPYVNPNPVGTFNVGFYYIVPNPFLGGDRFQVRIVSVTQTSQGTITNVEASSGLQYFSQWSTPTSYSDASAPNPTPYMGAWQGRVCLRLVDPDITNGANTTYRIEIAYLVSEPFFTVFDDLSLGSVPAPLPVNFIGLVANRNNNNVDLKWDVGEEINVKEYQVERSTTGGSFTTMGAIQAKGKSIYTFTDYNAPAGTVFYRIKSIDIDGRYKYSGIIRLAGNNSFSNGLNIYPIPAKDFITVRHALLSGGAKVVISATDGRVLKTIIPSAGSSNTQIDLNGVAPGTYIVSLDDGKGNIQTAKFVKE